MQYTIEGGTLPVLRITLNAGESLISEVGGRAWSRGPIRTETSGGGLGKMFGRALSGESLFLSRYTAEGPCEIAFTNSFPGQIVAVELSPGQSVIAQKTAFLCASSGVNLSLYFQKRIGTGFFGGEGFIMQKVTGPGMAFFEIDGHCVEYDLQAGEQIVADTGVVALMDETCTMDVRAVSGMKNALFGGEGLFDTVVTGPGKVRLQSMNLSQLTKLLMPSNNS